eukprot:2594757-Amphidinium_carterae.3
MPGVFMDGLFRAQSSGPTVLNAEFACVSTRNKASKQGLDANGGQESDVAYQVLRLNALHQTCDTRLERLIEDEKPENEIEEEYKMWVAMFLVTVWCLQTSLVALACTLEGLPNINTTIMWSDTECAQLPIEPGFREKLKATIKYGAGGTCAAQVEPLNIWQDTDMFNGYLIPRYCDCEHPGQMARCACSIRSAFPSEVAALEQARRHTAGHCDIGVDNKAVLEDWTAMRHNTQWHDIKEKTKGRNIQPSKTKKKRQGTGLETGKLIA